MREDLCRTPGWGSKRLRKRPGRGNRGGVAVELAICIVLLVGGAIVVWYLTGDSARQTFARLAARLAAAADSADRSPLEGSFHDQTSKSAGGIPRLGSRMVWLAAWFVVLGGACLGWLLFRYRSRRDDRAPTEKQQDKAVLESVPADQRDRLFEKRHQIFRILSEQPMNLFKNRVDVRQLMTHNLVAVEPETPVPEMVKLMKSRRMRHLLVRDEGGPLLGIISNRDLSYRRGKTAADLMTPDPISVSPETPVGPVITMLLDKHISCVPIVEDGTLCGVLTTTDLMMSLQCALQVLTRLAAELQSSARPEEAACP